MTMTRHLFYGRDDLKMAETEHLTKVVAALEQIKEIRPEVWKDLTLDERLLALQEVENLVSKLQGRPPVKVVTKPMSPGLYGSFDGKVIHINELGLSSNDVAEAVDTIIHEGRHAYQHYAVDNPGFHPDQQQVEAWRDNFDNYLTASLYGQEAYANQPVEADAWEYASTIRNQLYGKELLAMKSLDKELLTKHLSIDFGYPTRGAALVADKLLALEPSLLEQFTIWWYTGSLPRTTIEDYSIDRLIHEHGMTPIAAILTLDWLQREPEKAKTSLKRGHDDAVGKE